MNPVRRSLLLSAALGSLAASAHAASKLRGAPARRMPVLFIGHGSPMNALADNAFSKRLRAWGTEVPKPTAVLAISAHWLTPGKTLVDAQANPPTIHDFGGFPRALHEMQYPAPGRPELAQQLATTLNKVPVKTDAQWGLDHGTWSVLAHLFPKADIPVLQLSIDYAQPGAFHRDLGAELRFLRDQGVLIVGSGNIVHNLRGTFRGTPEGSTAARPWAQDFDDAVARALAERDDKALVDYRGFGMSAELAVPTPDHYWPFLYALGAAYPDEQTKTTYASFQEGTLSMRCLQWG